MKALQQPWRNRIQPQKPPINKKAPVAATAFEKLLVASALTTIAPAATIATTTASTAVAPAAASVSAPAATTPRWARLTRPGLVNGQRAAFHGLAVEFGDGVLSILLRTHRHKGKSARFTGEFILHERHFLDGTRL
jgi:phage protein D